MRRIMADGLTVTKIASHLKKIITFFCCIKTTVSYALPILLYPNSLLANT